MTEGYQKIRTIGKGSFGTATLYTRLKDEKLVVLKEISTVDMDYEERMAAYNEIKILSSLSHPNVIRYFDRIVTQNAIIIVMDYADGGNLTQLLNTKKSKNEVFKEKGILYIVFQISNALAYIHGKKILHRDLKPANIFLTCDGSVRIGDFGISKMLDTKSQAQTVVGTPYYLSPEMCEGHKYNEKSDIWALGCVIYEMATLKKPFSAPNLPLLVQKIVKCEYEAIPNSFCKDLKILVELMLQKKAAFRPTANFIYEVIIPDILAKNSLTFDYQALQNTEKSSSGIKERSVLYEITKDNGDINLQPITLPHKKIVDFSVSLTHSLAVFEDHTVYAWGSNKYCELGTKNKDTFVDIPVHVKSLEHLNIVKCVAGQNFSLFLTKTGQLYSCGRGNSGCLGQGNLGNVYFPILLKYLSKVIINDICCGNKHVVALDRDGRVYIWGSSNSGQLGLDNTGKILNAPKLLPLTEDIQKVYCSNDATILLSSENSLFVSGNNDFEKLGVRNKHGENIVHNFRRINNVFGEVVDVSMSESHTAVISSDGRVFLLGDNAFGQLGKANGFLKDNTNVLKLDNKIMKSSCSDTFTALLDEKNILWMCGTVKSTKLRNSDNFSCNNTLKIKTTVSLSQNQQEFENENVPTILNDNVSKDRIQGVKSIIALYSSKENLISGIYITMNNIKATDQSLFLLVNTTCPSAFKSFAESYKPSTFTKFSYAKTSTCCETEMK